MIHTSDFVTPSEDRAHNIQRLRREQEKGRVTAAQTHLARQRARLDWTAENPPTPSDGDSTEDRYAEYFLWQLEFNAAQEAVVRAEGVLSLALRQQRISLNIDDDKR